jgi:hypothetical protein
MINHIIHPFVIKRTARKARGLRLSPIATLDDAPIAAEQRAELIEAERKLLASGFAPASYAMVRNDAKTSLLTALFAHRKDPTTAGVLVIAGPLHPGSPTTRFETRFADGVKLLTTNSSTIVVTPTPPHFEGVRFRHVREVTELYSIHKMRVAERERSTTVERIPPDVDVIGDAEAEARKTQDYWVARGYYRYVDGDHMRFTWRGAILASWRRLFPWSLVTSLRNDRKTRLVCARLGIRMPPGA